MPFRREWYLSRGNIAVAIFFSVLIFVNDTFLILGVINHSAQIHTHIFSGAGLLLPLGFLLLSYLAFTSKREEPVYPSSPYLKLSRWSIMANEKNQKFWVYFMVICICILLICELAHPILNNYLKNNGYIICSSHRLHYYWQLASSGPCNTHTFTLFK